jgi:ABC-type branched-subunit amino acid transport system ATPase component
MSKQILHIENLSKSFGGLKLFNDVCITLHEGTINSLFGNNGSGKTTFFNLIGGYEKPDTGIIHFNGLTIKYHNEYQIVKAGIGKIWQEPIVFPNHTVLQNLLVSDKNNPGEKFLNYFFRYNEIKRIELELTEKANCILKQFKLIDKNSQPAGSLSLGEKKLLGIAMLLMNDARLLLLDEPFSNVTQDTIEHISDVLKELRQQGKTIFMIEHKIKYAAAISDYIFKIENYKLEKLN